MEHKKMFISGIGEGYEHAEGRYQDYQSITVTQSDNLDLCEFSEKMVDLLVETAQRALQAPNHEGLELACCLLADARKYDCLYYRARGVLNKQLLDAAKKLKE